MQDALRARVDDDDTAVPGIGDGHLAVAEQVGVVRRVEVAGGGSRRPRVSVVEDDAPRRIGDLDDRVVVLLVGDDRPPVVDEEGVVGEVEAAMGRRPSPGRVLPDDLVAVVEEEQPVVAAIGDQQLVPEERRSGARASGAPEGAVRDDHLDIGRRRAASALAPDDPEPSSGHGGTGVRDRDAQRARAQERGAVGLVGVDRARRPRRGVAAREVDRAVHDAGGRAVERLGEVADDVRRAGLGVDELHRSGGMAVRQQAAEDVDAASRPLRAPDSEPGREVRRRCDRHARRWWRRPPGSAPIRRSRRPRTRTGRSSPRRRLHVGRRARRPGPPWCRSRSGSCLPGPSSRRRSRAVASRASRPQRRGSPAAGFRAARALRSVDREGRFRWSTRRRMTGRRERPVPACRSEAARPHG